MSRVGAGWHSSPRRRPAARSRGDSPPTRTDSAHLPAGTPDPPRPPSRGSLEPWLQDSVANQSSVLQPFQMYAGGGRVHERDDAIADAGSSDRGASRLPATPLRVLQRHLGDWRTVLGQALRYLVYPNQKIKRS